MSTEMTVMPASHLRDLQTQMHRDVAFVSIKNVSDDRELFTAGGPDASAAQ